MLAESLTATAELLQLFGTDGVGEKPEERELPKIALIEKAGAACHATQVREKIRIA